MRQFDGIVDLFPITTLVLIQPRPDCHFDAMFCRELRDLRQGPQRGIGAYGIGLPRESRKIGIDLRFAGHFAFGRVLIRLVRLKGKPQHARGPMRFFGQGSIPIAPDPKGKRGKYCRYQKARKPHGSVASLGERGEGASMIASVAAMSTNNGTAAQCTAALRSSLPAGPLALTALKRPESIRNRLIDDLGLQMSLSFERVRNQAHLFSLFQKLPCPRSVGIRRNGEAGLYRKASE